MLLKHSKKKEDERSAPTAGVQAGDSGTKPGEGDEPDFESMLPDLKKMKRKKRKKTLIILAVVVVAAAAAVLVIHNLRGAKAQGGSAYTTEKVQKRDLTVTLSGSSNLKPANSYVVTSLLDGEILDAPFEEGDIVQKDTLLYQIDSSDAANGIEQAQNSLEESRNTYKNAVKSKDDLNIKSKTAGQITELDVKAGDTVTAGETIAKIKNSAVMSLKLPFEASDAEGFYVGQDASVTLDGSFETLGGTVMQISGVDKVLTGNRVVRDVTIDVNNPGGISTAQTATASVGGASCADSGTFAYKDESTVVSVLAGKIAQVTAAEGDDVKNGQIIAVIDSGSVDDSIFNADIAAKNAELALESQNKKLSDYTIKSPIAGTIVEKNYKKGDRMKSGKTLCTIFDLSYLTLTLNIDEQDIGKVQTGQEVDITADAAAGKTFKGVVTKININGTTTNGVTSYPVMIRIDDTNGLLPGMNVSAKIVVASLKNVLTVPVNAVVRNNLVLVRKADGTAPASSDPGLPPGYEYRQVTLGGSDKDYIAVTDGLKDGDTIAVMNSTAADTGVPGADSSAGADGAQSGASSSPKQSDGGSDDASGGNEG